MTGVLFDMDGVVVDSQRRWARFEREELLPSVTGGRPADPGAFAGMHVDEVYDHLSATVGTTVDRETFLDRYDRHATTLYGEEARLMPGFRGLRRSLRDGGVAVALVSSSPRRWIDLVLERFDLAFDAVVNGDDVDGASKPDPAIYRLATDRLGIRPGDGVAVEDTAHGVSAASGAGLAVIGYDAAGSGQDLAAADAVVTGPAALRAELGRRLGLDLDDG